MPVNGVCSLREDSLKVDVLLLDMTAIGVLVESAESGAANEPESAQRVVAEDRSGGVCYLVHE